MNFKINITILLLTLLTFQAVQGQVIDDTSNTNNIQTDSATTSLLSTDNYADDDFAPGLLIFAMIAIGFIFVCMGAGVLITILGLLIVFGLVSLSILSASVIVGLSQKSFARGFRTFIYLSAGVVCTVTGAAGLLLVNHLFDLHFNDDMVVLTGAVTGMLGSIVLSHMIFVIIKRMTGYFKQRLNYVQ